MGLRGSGARGRSVLKYAFDAAVGAFVLTGASSRAFAAPRVNGRRSPGVQLTGAETTDEHLGLLQQGDTKIAFGFVNSSVTRILRAKRSLDATPLALENAASNCQGDTTLGYSLEDCDGGREISIGLLDHDEGARTVCAQNLKLLRYY